MSSATTRRLIRTVILGSVTAAAAIWWLAPAFGADRDQLLDYVLQSTVFVLVLAVPAVLVGGLLVWLRRRKS